MEIYSDPTPDNAPQKFLPATTARTPLVDVCNLPETRFDYRATPKRHGDATHFRRSKLVETPSLSGLSSEALAKSPSSFVEPVVFSKLQNLEDLDVGAEIVLDKFGTLPDTEPVLPLDFGDAERESLNDEQFNQDLAVTAKAGNPLYCDHTYLTSRLEDEAKVRQSIHVLHVIDRCVGTDDGALSTTISAADKCIGSDLCLNTSKTTDTGVGSDVPMSSYIFTDMCVGTDPYLAEHTSSQVDVSMVTEDAVTSDCSVLATPDCLSQETMTELDAVDTGSSMTPFKLGKHGSRITAEEVRRQHPRVVANQIDSVMLSNQRLEKQAKSLERERTVLKSALKESKKAVLERDASIAELRGFLEDNQKKLSQHETALQEERMKCWNAEETLQSSVSELEKKCDDLERLHHEAELGFAEQLERVYLEAEEKSYKKQFESAQQKIRELQAAEEEYSQILNEVEKARNLQDDMKQAVAQLKAAASALARDKVQLQNENDSLKKRCVSKEVDLDVLRFINQELLLDNENMKELVSRSEQCIAELEGSVKVANTAISRLQEELSQCLADNAALTKAKEEMRRDRAIMIIKLSEQQDSETVALQALEEAEQELSKTEEALAKEKAILAAGKQMHERMKMEFEEKTLKLEMEVQHLEDLLDKSELKRNTQEQELFECQEQLYTLQERKAVFEATTLDMDSGVEALQDLQEQMEALLSTLNRKINHPRLKSQSAKVKSSTPKNQKYQRQSFVSQVLSSQLAAPCSAIKSSQKYSHDMTIDTSLPAVWQRQQSNVGFGASCVESGAAAAALISPHSRSFCGVTSNNENITVAPASSRKSVSFSEAPGSRRALFGDSDFKVKTSPQKGQDFMSGITSEMEDDGHSTTPGFARIKSIPRTSAGINRSETEESSGAESSGKSVDVSRLSTQVQVLCQLLRHITKAVQLVERESDLTIRDGQEELQVVTEQLKHENKMKQGLQLELEKKSESLDVVNSRQKDLQRRVSEMTKSLMNFHDQSLQISRLEEEKRDMKWKIADLEGQCSLLSSHLEAVVQKLDAAMAGQSEYDVASGQEVLALKKEKHELMMKLFAERDLHRNLGDKAVQKMKVLESNWKKAEDEVRRLDELVENVREGCVRSHAQSTHPLILDIVRLIDGKLPSLTTGDQE